MSGKNGQHAHLVEASLAAGDAARSALAASWQRSSKLHHLDPSEQRPPERLSDAELKHAKVPLEPLLAVAEETLDRLYLAVGGIGCCVLLADTNGIPMERRGAAADDATFENWGLWTGTVWSERYEGTNGIGTCLVEERGVTIHRDQHFFSRNTLLSCTTAPIFDQHGRLLAALDVSSCRKDLTLEFAQLIALSVADAARRIEADYFRQAFSDARIFLAPSTGSGPGGLVAVDADDLVVGASRAARQQFALSDEALARRIPASQVLGLPADSLESAERATLLRALARCGGQVSSAARDLGISRATLHRKLNRLNIRRVQ
ncbi:sigma-54-dependent Fis family transcriptional regulator [Aureimonas fodinaquatilis]|uniref:Sigma-54-dependent Fis family transcriptional regulator n=1 Tax=Aureimonas fodinaquatilis TaxID=2565783 RepID=A0A5B0DVP8_9HYPH|nr:GAF domain-containing protein [Aureimonas fodinaquatilis]KAA0970907.1 sigma-54-dependent Fis family transcriptional regulator [Aureimonas fodinaquatilis]